MTSQAYLGIYLHLCRCMLYALDLILGRGLINSDIEENHTYSNNKASFVINYDDTSAQSICEYARQFVGKNLSEIITETTMTEVREEAAVYGTRRKGHFGDLVEKHLFGIKNNSDAAADFPKAGLELKTTPLKFHAKNRYAAKERLVFSMINYENIIFEEWETSSFLKKNNLLLLMFYLYQKELDITEYKFKFVHLLNLLSDISLADIAQIKKDWQTIVDKIKAGEAHLLSEGDTSYLGAATKASKATDRRPQPNSDEQAKPRAFSLKPTYLNFIIQGYLGKKGKTLFSLTGDTSLPLTIEENVQSRLSQFFGKTNVEIEQGLGISYDKRPKNHRRLLLNRLFGGDANKIEELEKANITMRTIKLECTGKLVESISFPTFKYCEIVLEGWDQSAFYEQLTTKRFLFVVFQENKDGTCTLQKIKFWNFPMKDLSEAQWVWEETVKRIKGGDAINLPKIKDNPVSHVRPHARNAKDTFPTPYGEHVVKKCFWLNAKYIEQQLSG